MARTADTATTYKVKIHTNNGYRYASTQPLIVDPERTSGRNKHKRIHWGTLDDDMKFHPNNNYIMASPEERAKLIFPDDWDMSEAKALPSERKAGRPWHHKKKTTTACMVISGYWNKWPSGQA